MPACPTCQSDNPEGYRFCGRCGTELGGTRCAACNAPNPAGQPFCGQCGNRLVGTGVSAEDVSGPPLAPVEERKLATVLFADVVGFTSLAERTDPEVVARMVDAAFVDLGKVVADHGGTVDKYMGDSVMAVFGVPVAHDDDAERAVAAGLAMRRLGGDLVFAIGINSGEVMATSLGRGDFTVIGDTVNVAARLEKAAAPGEVLCGRVTAELARRRVDFHERQPVLLKGKAEPVEVFEAVRLRRGGDLDAERVPLVGRDDEFAFLEMQWRRVREDGQGKLVVVCGEAGSGKTCLLDALAESMGDDATIIRSAYPAYGVMGGMRVAAELVDQLGSSADRDVDARVRSVAGDLDPSLLAMDAAALRQEQIWALGKLLKEKACGGPLVIMVDDMHGGDERTLELLGELAVRMRDIPIFTVVAGRTEPAGWLTRFAAATTVRLSPLAPNHAGALASALVGDKPLAPEAAAFLVEITNGNPLYLRELVAMARERNLLVDDGDVYRLTAHAGIPASLQALLAARLDALDRGRKHAVQQLALLGEATTAELAGLGGPDIAAELRALVDSGMVRQSGDGRFEIADPLLGEVAYDMLPHHLRGELHRRAAAVVERSEERARHLERAAEFTSGDEVLAAEAAAALAEEGMRLAQATRHLEAMHLLERAERLGMRRAPVLIELGRLQALCGKEEEALLTLSGVEDDPDDPAVAVERDHTAANVKVLTDPGWSLPRLEAVAERWRAIDNTSKEAWAHANTGVAYFYLSRMVEAAAVLDRAVALFRSVGDRAGEVATTSFLSLARPDDPRVDGWLADALAYANEAGDRNKQLTVLASTTWRQFFHSFCGTPEEMAEAEDVGTRFAALAEEIGAGDMAMHGFSLMAVMARLTGRFDKAAAHVTALQRLLATSRVHEPWLAWAASFVVEVAAGADAAAPPYPPRTSVDPVHSMAKLLVHEGLLLSGRAEEALSRMESEGAPTIEGAMGDIGGLVYALGLSLCGRARESGPWLDRAASASMVLDSPAALAAVAALRAESSGRWEELPPAPAHPARGLAEALVLRAHACHGDTEALGLLRRSAAALAMPGLLPLPA
ncbi:MAG: adenylate/guanylate cyclase domain-containing protein [Acidimicrobiales bacterium]